MNDIIKAFRHQETVRRSSIFIAGRRHAGRHAQARQGRNPALDAKSSRRRAFSRSEAGTQASRAQTPAPQRLRDDVRRELVLDEGNAVPQIELALLQALHLSLSEPGDAAAPTLRRRGRGAPAGAAPIAPATRVLPLGSLPPLVCKQAATAHRSREIIPLWSVAFKPAISHRKQLRGFIAMHNRRRASNLRPGLM